MLKHFMYKTIFRLTGAKKVLDKQGDELRDYILKTYRNGATSAPEAKVRKNILLKQVSVCGKPCYIAGSKKRKGKKAVLFTHGGAYFEETLSFQWEFIQKLTDASGALFFVPEYPLSPEHDCEPAFNMILELYKKMLKRYKPEDIIIMGDSAGGAITLSLAMLLREQELPQPSQIVLLSPSVDFSSKIEPKDKAYAEYLDKRDPMLSLKASDTVMAWWKGNYDDKDYRVRPLYGDLRGLAPIMMFSGTADVLNLCARKLVKKAKEQNVNIEYYEKKGMIHDWVLLGLWESKEYERIIENVLQ